MIDTSRAPTSKEDLLVLWRWATRVDDARPAAEVLRVLGALELEHGGSRATANTDCPGCLALAAYHRLTDPETEDVSG